MCGDHAGRHVVDRLAAGVECADEQAAGGFDADGDVAAAVGVGVPQPVQESEQVADAVGGFRRSACG
jgi:hypothetical protein